MSDDQRRGSRGEDAEAAKTRAKVPGIGPNKTQAAARYWVEQQHRLQREDPAAYEKLRKKEEERWPWVVPREINKLARFLRKHRSAEWCKELAALLTAFVVKRAEVERAIRNVSHKRAPPARPDPARVEAAIRMVNGATPEEAPPAKSDP